MQLNWQVFLQIDDCTVHYTIQTKTIRFCMYMHYPLKAIPETWLPAQNFDGARHVLQHHVGCLRVVTEVKLAGYCALSVTVT